MKQFIHSAFMLIGVGFANAADVEVLSPFDGQWIVGNDLEFGIKAPAGAEVVLLGQKYKVDSTGLLQIKLKAADTISKFDVKIRSKGQETVIPRTLFRKKFQSESYQDKTGRWWILPISVQDRSIYVSPQWKMSLGKQWVMDGLAQSLMLEAPKSQEKCIGNCWIAEAQSLGVQYAVDLSLVGDKNSNYQWKMRIWDVGSARQVKEFVGLEFRTRSEIFESLLRLGKEVNLWNSASPQAFSPKENLPLLAQEPKILTGVLPDTLHPSNLPYQLAGMALVPQGRTLVIDSGVQIQANPKSTLRVFGSLIAQGTPANPIQIQSRSNGPDSAWNGIEVESNQPFRLENIKVSGAKVGVNAASSNLWLQNVTFEQNYLTSLRAENSDVYLENADLSGSRSVGVLLDQFSIADFRNVKIDKQDLGIVLRGQSSLNLIQSNLESNHQALLLDENISLKMVQTTIRQNRIGAVLAQNKVDRLKELRPVLTNINQNDENFVVIPVGQIQSLISQLRVSDEFDVPLYRRAKFKNEVLSENSEALTPSEWAGSVQISSDFQSVKTAHSNTARGVVVQGDTVFNGESYPNRFQIPGFNQRLSFFATKQNSASRSELSVDFWQNSWNDFRVNPVNFFTEKAHQALWLGDFRNSIHDLVLGGDPILGARYQIKSNPDLRKESALKWDIFGGEWRRSLKQGQPDPDLYSVYVEEGNSQAQRLGLGSTMNLSFSQNQLSLGYLGIYDTRSAWLRTVVPDSQSLRDPVIQGNHLFAQTQLGHRSSGWKFNGFVGYGSADSTEGFRSRAVEQWLLSNNIIEEADTLRTLLLKAHPSTVLLSFSLPKELDLTAKEILNQVDSIEAELQNQKDQQRSLPMLAFGAPDMAMQAGVEWQGTGKRFAIEGVYVGNRYFSPAFPTQNQRRLSANGRWMLGSKWNQILLLRAQEDHVSDGDSWEWGWEKGDVWGVQKWTSSPIAGRNALNPNPRNEYEISFENKWALPEELEISAVYQNLWTHQVQERLLRKDTSEWTGVFADPYFSANDGEESVELPWGKQSFLVSRSKWDLYLQTKDTLAWLYQQRWLDHRLRFDVRKRIGQDWSYKFGISWQRRIDLSLFHVRDDLMDQFEDSTLNKMGYLPSGDGSWSLRFPMSMQWSGDALPFRLDFFFGQKHWLRKDEKQFDYGGSLSFKRTLIPNRLDFENMINLRVLSTTKDQEQIYFEDAQGLKYPYYTQDSLGVVKPQNSDAPDVFDVQPGLKAEGFNLGKTLGRHESTELDFSIVPSLKIGLADAWSMSIYGLYEIHQRPDVLSEEYQWWKIGSSLTYIF